MSTGGYVMHLDVPARTSYLVLGAAFRDPPMPNEGSVLALVGGPPPARWRGRSADCRSVGLCWRKG